VTVVAVLPVRAPRPVRADRRLALLGELSWNGLAGFGPNLIFHVDPHFSLDLGLGLAFVGWKLGLRSRYNFLTSEVTPFIGAGFLGATGFDAPSQDIGADDDNRELNIKAKPSAFAQLTVGLDYTDSDGFTFLGAIGYAILLSHDNVEVVTGEPTREEEKAFDVIFGTGLVLSVGLGYSFR
jgi:preprotein translocase subunit Sss1